MFLSQRAAKNRLSQTAGKSSATESVFKAAFGWKAFIDFCRNQPRQPVFIPSPVPEPDQPSFLFGAPYAGIPIHNKFLFFASSLWSASADTVKKTFKASQAKPGHRADHVVHVRQCRYSKYIETPQSQPLEPTEPAAFSTVFQAGVSADRKKPIGIQRSHR